MDSILGPTCQHLVARSQLPFSFHITHPLNPYLDPKRMSNHHNFQVLGDYLSYFVFVVLCYFLWEVQVTQSPRSPKA